MFPECLTQENFPLFVRAIELLDQASRARPGDRCNRSVQTLDHLTVSALTERGTELCRSKQFTQAEGVLEIAVKIQEWLHHPNHQGLSSPLLVLGEVYEAQFRLKDASEKYSRAWLVSGFADAGIERQMIALHCLIRIYGKLGRPDMQEQMRGALERLRNENPFVIKDRPNKPYE
jgi:hypothetical protein